MVSKASVYDTTTLLLSAWLCPAGCVGHGVTCTCAGPVPSSLRHLHPLPESLSFRNRTHPLSGFSVFLSPFFYYYMSSTGIFFFHFYPLGHLCCSCSLSSYDNFQNIFFFTFAKPVLAGIWEAQMRLRATQALVLAVLILVVSWGEAIEDPPGIVITL